MLRLFCEKCNEPIYENPVPASCVIVAKKNTDILLVKRSVDPKKGYWCLPGGYMELGESPEQAALRELKEETGLTGQIDMLLGVTASNSDQYNSVLMIGYLTRRTGGTLTPGDDALEAAYFKPDSLPEIAFDSHKRFIRIYYASYSNK